MNRLRNERGLSLVELLAVLTLTAVVFTGISMALHSFRANVASTVNDIENDRHISEVSSILDRMFSNATEVRAVSERQVNMKLYETDDTGTAAAVYKSLYYENGSLLACPTASIDDVLTAPCDNAAIITDRLESRPIFASVTYSSGGARSDVVLSASGGAGTAYEFGAGQLIGVTLPFSFQDGIITLHLKLMCTSTAAVFPAASRSACRVRVCRVRTRIEHYSRILSSFEAFCRDVVSRNFRLIHIA
jgi:hypothetical protein